MTRAAPFPRPRTRTPRGYAVVLLLLLVFGLLVTTWWRERWTLSLFQSGAYLLGIAWIVSAWRHSRPVRQSLLLYLLAGTVLWGLAQLALDRSIYRWETWEAVLTWTANLTICFLALQVSAESRMRQTLLRWFLWFGFGVSILSTLQAFTSGGAIFWWFPSGYSKVFGPFLSPNQYAAFLESLIPLAIVQGLKGRRDALLCLTAASVMAGSVIASASRSGAVLVALEITVTLLLALATGLAGKREVLMAFGQMLVISLLAVGVVGWEGVWKRLQESDPYAVRRELALSTQDMIRDRPWFGFGLGTWATAYPGYARFDDGRFANQAHNDWLQWAAEGGIPFLLLMLAIALWSLPPAIRSLWGLGLLTVFLHALVDYPMQQRPALAAWFFALLGVLAAHQRAADPDSRRGAARGSSTGRLESLATP